MADPLELLADIQLGGVQVDEFPGEPEYLAFAQAQDQDQDEGGVECLASCQVDSRNQRASSTVQALRFRRLTVRRFVSLMAFTGFLVTISSSKTALTEPAQPRNWQRSGAGTRVARSGLTLTRQGPGRPTSPGQVPGHWSPHPAVRLGAAGPR